MIAIINYGVGNLSSILNMFKRLGVDASITSDKNLIDRADKILIPGVGHFDTCMKNFNESGLRSFVEKKVIKDKIITLGICVGAQMITRGSEEGNEKGLAWVNADTVKFNVNNQHFKIPHMGWTDLEIKLSSPLWNDLPDPARFYFAHSYHFKFDTREQVTATSNYGYEYPCAFMNENIFGLQFHPEKSHKYGMKVLSNFASCCPK